MARKHSFLFAFAAVSAGALSALCDVTVTNVAERLTFRTSATVSTATMAVIAEPGLPTPLFHFDSRRTDSWTFNGAKVTKIPSLEGNRYLKGGDGVAGATGVDGGCWPAGDTVHRPPEFSVDETLGENVLDFGPYGSFYGMLFDPVDFSAEKDGSALTNVLQGIGTVVAVWYSNSADGRSGGYILGGGSQPKGTDTAFEKKNWSRADSTSNISTASPLLHFRAVTCKTAVRHDGVWTTGTHVGFKGNGWEVVTAQPVDATFEASGVGCGGGRHSTGGFKVAEMYIFGEVLPESKIGELEAWLSRKWFGDAMPGYNGDVSIGEIRATSNANNHVAAKVTLDVASGDTLSVDSLRGGHGAGGAYIKTGAGTLALGDISSYGGDLKLDAGALNLTKRAVPAAGELPKGLYVHFDASAAGCVAETSLEDGVTYVSLLSNLVADAKYSGAGPIYARPEGQNSAYRPWLVENALGPGLNVLDFGPFTSGGKTAFPNDGRFLRLTTTKTGSFSASALNLYACTAIAVIGAQRGGGHLLGYSTGGPNMFARSNDAWMSDVSWNAAAFFDNTAKGDAGLKSQTAGMAYVNGVRRPTDKAFMTPGYQVVALQTHGGCVSLLGGFQYQRAGGMRIGEIMLYSRVLSEREIKDVSAYLYNKWFGGHTPGYGMHADGRADVKSLVASGSADVSVAGDIPVRVASLSGPGTIDKKGSGTLEIESAAATGELRVSEGVVAVVPAPDVSTNCELAKGALLHLDASDTASMEAPYGTNIYGRVEYWYDKSGRGNVAAASANIVRCPYLNTTDLCNGLPVMDFRTFNTSTGGCMALARTIDSARAIYVVWGSQNGGGHIFGHPDGNNWTYADENNVSSSWLDFTRKNMPNSSPGGGVGFIMDHQSSAQTVATGSFYTNGVKTALSALPTGGYQLLEFHTGEPASVAGLNLDRGGQPGGGRYGEIVVYDRVLSEREKISTRNYFLKKWFGAADGDLAQLPEKDVPAFAANVTLAGGSLKTDGAAVAGDFAFAGGSRWNLAVDSQGAVTNGFVSATGTLSFGEGVDVSFAGLDGVANLGRIRIAVASAGGYDGIDNLNAATVAGYPFTPSQKPVFFVKPSGELCVRFGQPALMLMIR